MGDELDLMQVAIGAAAALVADTTKQGWENVRSAMARCFRRGGGATAEQELRLLDAARQRLTGSAESERRDVAEKLEQELAIPLAAFLQKNPEAASDLQALADQSDRTDAGAGLQANVRGNTNSQVLIAGRDASAGSYINRATEGEKRARKPLPRPRPRLPRLRSACGASRAS
ncbi:hypothetical protein [Streptomyces sp. NPDC017529]|uniref:hypothetical protein n=1 Tax=Streptomyces sp. NPDC017529 TaxID=3365000 RepID=UPI0037B9D825